MRCILISLFLLFSGLTNAQEPLFKHYGVRNGLPTEEVYAIIQDDQGYIWFGTDLGLVKYDGINMNTYTTADGLTSNVVLALYKGINNKIWISSYTKGVSYYKDGKFYPAPFNEYINPEDGFITHFLEQADSTIYFMCAYSKYLYHYKNNKLTKLLPDSVYNGSEDMKYIRFIKEIDSSFFFEHSVATINTKDTTHYLFDTVPYPNIKLHTQDHLQCLEISFTSQIYSILKLSDGSKLIFINNIRFITDKTPHFYFLRIHNDSLSILPYKIDVIVNSMYIDEQKNLFLLTQGNGVLVFKNEDLNSTPIHLLGDKDVGNMIVDHEGNYWFTTTQNGVFQVPSLNIIKISGIKNENIHLIGATQNELIVEDKSGNYYLHQIENQQILPFSLKHADFFFTSKRTDDILFVKDNVCYIYNTSDKSITSAHYSGGVNDVYEDQTYTYSISNGAVNRHNNLMGDILNRAEDITKSKFRKLYVQSSHEIWIGSIKGLMFSDGYSVSYNYPNPITERITHLVGMGGKQFAVATKESGLIIRNGDTNLNIRKQDGLPSDIITAVFYDKKLLWVATADGFCSILFNESTNGYEIVLYDIFSPSVIGAIRTIELFKGYLYLGTSTGLYRFSTSEIYKKNISLPVIIKSIIVNNKAVTINKAPLAFSPFENNFEFSFQGFTYTSPKQLKYKYILKGYNNDTIYTTNTSIQYTNLADGDYTFIVYAATNNKNWSNTPAVYTFSIAQHYTKSWWFILLMVLAGLLIVSSVFLLIIRNLKRRNEIQRELLLLEQKALRAQMNPHFTFNALNSIQYFITDNNKRAATTFLSKFSKLVRNILNNSKSNTISLADEISTLTTYLELEQMRFNGKIAIGIYIGDDFIPDDIFIPSMIIQPFVENAIWHGIMPKEDGMGKLELSFELRGNTLVCKVKDNGIGRKKSAELKEQTRKGHKSAGLKNIDDRIAVLNHINKTQIDITVTDLYEADNAPTGTEVMIYFELEKE